MAALAALRIDGPPPAPRPYGLVTTPGTIVEQDDPHWAGGVVVDTYPTNLPSSHNPCSLGTMRVKEGGDTAQPFPEFSSFTVYFTVECSGIGIGNEAGAERLRNRARALLAATESFQVEREFAFAPADADRPHLTGAGYVDLNSGAAVGPTEGFSLAEQAIGETARAGVIHTDPATAIAAAAKGIIEAVGQAMRTKLGTLVIVGDGYIGATPGPVLGADQGYLFVTGPVRLTRDDVEVLGPTREVLDRETNAVVIRAERNYVAYWDTALHAGVRVDRSTTP
jgi:hypothetical protein